MAYDPYNRPNWSSPYGDAVFGDAFPLNEHLDFFSNDTTHTRPVLHHYDEPGSSTWPSQQSTEFDQSFNTDDQFLDFEAHEASSALGDEQEPPDDNITIGDSAIDVKAPCPECGKELCKKGISKHIKRVHHKDDHSILCPQCGKSFFSKKDLHDHISSHSELRKEIYICPKHGCGRRVKGFTRRDNALRHVQTEHPELIKYDAHGRAVKGCVKFESIPYQHLER